jgi:hypothetical protein
LIKQGKRQDVAEMHLYDGQRRLAGHGTGTFIVLPDVPLSTVLGPDDPGASDRL